MEDVLLRQTAFDDLVTEILASFASSDGAAIDRQIQTSLGKIARFIGVDYALVIETPADQASWSVTHEWFAPGVPSQRGRYQRVPMGAFDWTEQRILAGQTVVLNSLDEMPPEAADTRKQLELAGFQSTLQVPLRGRGGSVSGCIALSSIRREITWADSDVKRLKLLGEAVAGTMERRRAEMGLRGALEEVERLTERLRAENVYLQQEITGCHGFDEIIGQSELLRTTLSKVEHVAGTDASVLLVGETGTGKELFARAIHHHSRRSQRPLVKVNLAALPSSLIESELFGHVKGAFTGAISDKIGRFELADGGTLFLDEIGELDPELQTKLLRVLQEGEFERIGSAETVRVDVRVVAATNRDLHRAMDRERFRPDLYYRLAVFPIEVPPLRTRREDIPLLVWHFISKKQGRLGTAIKSIPQDVMNTLVEYDWPGNVRELENVVERAMILTRGSSLALEEHFRPARPQTPKGSSPAPPRIDRGQILRTLEECCWKIKGAGNAADRLGVKPSTLRYRMKRLRITRPVG